jgi:hypothetical protein
MSINNTIVNAVNTCVDEYIQRICQKYTLDPKELRLLWCGQEEFTPNITKTNYNNCDVTPEKILKCDKNELIALCKSKGLKCSGTKSLLINRLLGKEDNAESSSVETKTKQTKQTKQAKINELKVAETPVVIKLTAKIPNVIIKRNKFNNYEHTETNFLFDNETKFVIGKQNDNGTIDTLNENDIDKCNAFKFKFNLPNNLDSKQNLSDVKVTELDEDDEDNEQDEDDENNFLNEDDIIGDEEDEDNIDDNIDDDIEVDDCDFDE